MSELSEEDVNRFNHEEVERNAGEVIDNILAGKVYNQELVPLWQNLICEGIMKQLIANEFSFKYMINCCIMQNVGVSLQSATSQFCGNPETDFSLAVIWPSEKQKENYNKYLICSVNIYAVAF